MLLNTLCYIIHNNVAYGVICGTPQKFSRSKVIVTSYLENRLRYIRIALEAQ
jgi:hypothetical protein